MNTIQQQLSDSRVAKQAINELRIQDKQRILERIASLLQIHSNEVLQQNQLDLERMENDDPKYDRLKLTVERIEGLAQSVLDISRLADPTDRLLSTKKLDNGLLVEKRTVALGVVGVIYESRPNVTIDVAALCIQSGNVCLLRGGSDAWYTNRYLVGLLRQALVECGTDPNIVQLLPTERALVNELLEAVRYVDIIIPRGSQGLIDFVRQHAKVPVIETGAGVCHTYVEASADLAKAARIVANAKISRPSVCNALDTVLVDDKIDQQFIEQLIPYFSEAAVDVFASDKLYDIFKNAGYPFIHRADDADFGREFLDLKCSIKEVDGLEEALTHIAHYSSKHSECIVSQDSIKITKFMRSVDAAAVYSNASTRFTDGGEFGLGAEIGISTQKLHARGPFALEKLVTEKWFVTGDGQIR
ncbi:glutamate-5-semialdehyde dehydrogenase [Sphingobacterium faecale]|uniref:Gamma-glutamyl phosphate reductase n=1 Tax=Sphingobacterium faecale TaxID=2803775 RepID=A0ABS1R623_9SPHI|nr:glutamate-5-semialdehyde dehydrogenase [Sphingobacterium faecale]MBL1409965.1 glutamate-5-semialdehyde dehydrogenase [Sphingobacterium faecale]